MSTFVNPSFGRLNPSRVPAALALAALLALPFAGHAATVTLQGGTGASCIATNIAYDPSGNVTVTCQATVTTYALTTTLAGAGTGSVASNPAGITCPGTCSTSFNSGVAVTIAATPTAGSSFAGWTGGGCSGTGNCTVTMSAATSVTATFDLIPTATAPGAPSLTSGIPGDGSLSFGFTPPASNGGSAITGYTATCTPVSGAGTFPATGTASPLTVPGLANGTFYRCSVAAANAIGTGASSNEITTSPQAAVPLLLVGVSSRALHGAAGTFDIAVDLAPVGTAVTVEPRAIGAGHTIVFHFNGPVTAAGTAAAVDALAAPIGTSTPVIAVNNVVVTLTAIPNNQRVTVSLTGVNGTGNFSVSLGFLVGDTNNSRSVTSSDILGIKGHSGQPVDSSNFRFDVNASGAITATDILTVKGNSGQALP